MRLIVDLKTHLVDADPSIIQVEKAVPTGTDGEIPVNGKYVIPVPLDLDFPVDSSSYVLSGGLVDGGDVTSTAFGYLLAQYPQYSHIYFNPLLLDEHVDELDEAGTWNDGTDTFTSRFQSGRRASAGADTGNMPNNTALLPLNSSVSPSRPGLIVTDEIDLSPYILDCDGNPVGASQFMVYWKLFAFRVTEDIAADYGANAGSNEPAIRYLQETAPEPSSFAVYISTDNGSTWSEVGLLEPFEACAPALSVRLAFVNTSRQKRYLTHYALLFG